eukprot:7022595-Ditylum_brightwellii.AAC.1
MMQHRVSVDLNPTSLGGSSEMCVDEEHTLFEWDNKKSFLRTQKPNEEDMEKLETFELNSHVSDKALELSSMRRKKKVESPSDIPLCEWQKRLAMVPEEVINKTLENSTYFYLSIEAKICQDLHRHFWCQFSDLHMPRQHETVTSGTFFPTLKSQQGNTCSHFFVGTTSTCWEVFHLKKESHNGQALQDHKTGFQGH